MEQFNIIFNDITRAINPYVILIKISSKMNYMNDVSFKGINILYVLLCLAYSARTIYDPDFTKVEILYE